MARELRATYFNILIYTYEIGSTLKVKKNYDGDVFCTCCNEAGSKVEAGVDKSPPLSLFRREENRDGDIWESYALNSYRSTTTYAICHCTKIQAEGATIGIDHVL